jgi:putative salt-induced outer membrane protein
VTSMGTDPVVTEDISDVAFSVSSNVFKSLSDATYVTNDTDVIYSETATTVTNELALNVAMTETLSLRTSLTTFLNS